MANSSECVGVREIVVAEVVDNPRVINIENHLVFSEGRVPFVPRAGPSGGEDVALVVVLGTKKRNIDGGGTTAIVAGDALVHLEDQICLQTSDPHAQIADSFEIIAALEERPHDHHFSAKKEWVLPEIESDDIVSAFEDRFSVFEETPHSHRIVNSSIMKESRVEDAHKLFDMIPVKDVIVLFYFTRKSGLEALDIRFDEHASKVALPQGLMDAKVTMLGVIPSLVRSWRNAHSTSYSTSGYDWSSIRYFGSTGEASNVDEYLWLMGRACYKPIIEDCRGMEIGGGSVSGSLLQVQSLAAFSTPTIGCSLFILDDNRHLIPQNGSRGESLKIFCDMRIAGALDHHYQNMDVCKIILL
ncbi:hypothetical protein SESBI_09714 [Sesbania bispinosa]|nr:hypothetical protein SESBI_09714 [Sesbania bispinosa]